MGKPKQPIINRWKQNGVVITQDDISLDIQGFVYVITNTTNHHRYIGRKHTWTGKDTKAKPVKPSNWQRYWGSNKELQADIKRLGVDKFTREILSFHKTKRETNYAETKELFARDVLNDLTYYNANIMGKFFRKS